MQVAELNVAVGQSVANADTWSVCVS